MPPRFMRDVTSIRVKLLKSAVARDMIKYEVSLRGQWRELDILQRFWYNLLTHL
jgi:hypothetical protein